MAELFNKNMNIIAQSDVEIQIDPVTKDMNIIQKLDDEPNDVGGLTAAQLKAKFDEGGNALKDYINNSLIPQILSDGATEAQREANEAQRESNEFIRQQDEHVRNQNELERRREELKREAAEQARNVWEDYDSTKSYVSGNKVYYLGSSYVNIAGCQGIEPTNTAHWQIVAKKGADGEGSLSPEEADLRYLKLSGGTMTGGINLTQEGVSKTGRISMVSAGGMGYSDQYVNIGGAKLLPRLGLELFGNRVEHVGNPTEPGDAANKRYVDGIIQSSSVPSRTVSVAAAELPDYIAALPRLLTENLTIITSGTLTADYLKIYNFYGPGSLMIQANADGDAVLKAAAYVFNCTILVYFNNIQFQDPEPGDSGERFGIKASAGSTVRAFNCSFSSTDGGTLHQEGYTAIYAYDGGVIDTSGVKNLSGCACAANASRGGVIVCSAATADAMHDNVTGAIVWEGGIVYVAGNSPATLGGTSNTKYCGLIVKGGAPI